MKNTKVRTNQSKNKCLARQAQTIKYSLEILFLLKYKNQLNLKHYRF